MTGNEIRSKFLTFFESKGHKSVSSSSLIPANDPTLLFTNAGMNQFKDTFLGTEKRAYSRATTSQKCVRAGGKHNDLENVGRTRRHHTFFEMLGTFRLEITSSGRRSSLPGSSSQRFMVWIKIVCMQRFTRMTTKRKSFGPSIRTLAGIGSFGAGRRTISGGWGTRGPCGPCSEIFYDFGPVGLEPGEEDEPFPSEVSRYVEIWNLVFMQFDRDTEGNLSPLPRPSIDTGMGLERVAAVLQES